MHLKSTLDNVKRNYPKYYYEALCEFRAGRSEFRNIPEGELEWGFFAVVFSSATYSSLVCVQAYCSYKKVTPKLSSVIPVDEVPDVVLTALNLEKQMEYFDPRDIPN